MSRRKSTLTVKLALAGSGRDFVPPEWIMLIPAGRIEAVDGRSFVNDAPQAVVAAFQRQGLELPIDINHRMELMPAGEEAPAMGWIAALDVRDGAIWARVEWTPRGEEALRNREYRYISPAFLHDEQGRILELLSAALVTQPAFRMPALAAREPSHQTISKEQIMDRKALCQRLGLPEDADDAAVLAAIDALKKATASQDKNFDKDFTPDKFVPRADYDRVQAELAAARKELAERERRALAEAAEALVEEGIKAGKIAPASRDFWLGVASENKEGLRRVEQFLASAPQIVPVNEQAGSDDACPPKKALTAAEKQVAAVLGLTDEEFIAARDEADGGNEEAA